MNEDTVVTTVRRVRRLEQTLKMHRRAGTLDDLLPRQQPDLATADTAPAIVIAARPIGRGPESGKPTLMIMRPTFRQPSRFRWWLMACPIAIAGMLVLAVVSDRELASEPEPFAVQAVAMVSKPTPSAPMTRVDPDDIEPLRTSMALADAPVKATAPVHIAKRVKRSARTRRAPARWNPDALFLSK